MYICLSNSTNEAKAFHFHLHSDIGIWCDSLPLTLADSSNPFYCLSKFYFKKSLCTHFTYETKFFLSVVHLFCVRHVWVFDLCVLLFVKNECIQFYYVRVGQFYSFRSDGLIFWRLFFENFNLLNFSNFKSFTIFVEDECICFRVGNLLHAIISLFF